MTYDAFISYSHAADDALAPALQHGLQSLARPWNRRRALEIFRDDTGLAVSPGLWSSITAALDESTYFVLLASPEAAASPWVNREIEHWVASHSIEQLLPVVTDGEWAWDSIGDFDWERSSAVPSALRGLFTEEPRHLDLRWAKGENQLDLRNSRWREAVAQLAAPMHSMSPQDLESEDVSHYRRVVRLRRAVVVVLSVLLVLVSVAGILAVQNARDANRAEARAQASAREAEEQADRALAGQLLAQAAAFRGREPTLSLLLSIEASKLTPEQGWTSLVDGLRATSGVETILEVPSGIKRAFFAVDPTGDVLAAPTVEGDGVQLWSLRSGEVTGDLLTADEIYPESPTSLVFGSSGALAARYDCSRNTVCSAEEARHSHLVVRDPASAPVRLLRASDGYTDPAFSPDGHHLAAFTSDGRVRVWTTQGVIARDVRLGAGTPTALAVGRAGETLAVSTRNPARLYLWDFGATRSAQPTIVPTPPGEYAVELVLGAGALLVSRNQQGTVDFWDARAGSRRGGLSPNRVGRVVDVAVGPEGTLATADANGLIQLWDTETGVQRGTTHPSGSASDVRLEFTPDGGLVSVGDDIRLWDVPGWDESGSNLYRHRAAVTALAVSDDGTLVSGDSDGVIAVSTLGAEPGQPRLVRTGQGALAAIAVSDAGFVASGGEDGTVRLWETSTGTLLDTLGDPSRGAVRAVAISPDGSRVAAGYAGGDGDADQQSSERMLLWDVASGDVVESLQAGLADDVTAMVYSHQGTLGSAGSDNVTVWDRATLETTVVSPVPGAQFSAIAFSPNGEQLASSGFERAGARTGRVILWDLTVKPPVAVLRFPAARAAGWDGRFASLDYSPDGTVLIGAGDGGVQFWDVAREEPLGGLVGPAGATAAVVGEPVGDLLIAGYETGAVQAYPATIEGWRAAACSIVSRNLTGAEWTSVVGTGDDYRETCPQY